MDDETICQLICYAIAFGTTAGISLVMLLGLYSFVPGLRRRWFPIDRLQPGTWTGRDVFIASCVYFASTSLIPATLLEIGFFTPLIGPPPESNAPALERTLYSLQCVAISSPITLSATLGTLFAVMFIATRSRPHDYGLTWARWPANLGLGLAAFLVTWPIIMGIQALAVLVFEPASDPFAALAKLDLPAWEWLLFGFQMTIAAPVIEETLFRGILQGWLRRASLAGQLTLPFVTLYFAAAGFVEYDKNNENYVYHYGPLVFAMVLAAGYLFWVYRLSRRFALSDAEIQGWQPLPIDSSLAQGEPGSDWQRQPRERDADRMRQWGNANADLAIYGTAMLFAIVHSPNWPAPVALFPMGLALGWLSRRTHSLVGPIVFHAVFNLTSFLALYGLSQAPP